MPTLQQVGESSSRSDFHRLIDGSLDETFLRSPSADKLLNLNMPRGSLVGGSGSGSLQGSWSSFTHAHEQGASSPPLFAGSPTSRPFSADDSGYLASQAGSVPGSPHPLDMSRKGGEDGHGREERRQPRYHFSMPHPHPAASPTPTPPQSPYSPGGGLPRPLRAGSQTFSDCGSPLEHPFLMNSSSRSNSPESDGSLSSLDNANISDLMSCLYLQARTRSDSGLSVGPPNSYDDHPPLELGNYINQYSTPSAWNSQSLKYYQQNQQRQWQSPLGSPLSSPLASTDKSWSPGSLNNSMSNPLSSSLPGSPLYMSSPIRSSAAPAPGTPPSPGLGPGPVVRMSSSLDSNGSLSRFQRGAVASQCDATCTWSGTLPKRSFENATFSVKVFLGGVPWDINEAMLCNAFKQCGPGQIRVEWPLSRQQGSPPPKGYVYVIFECEKQVRALLQACSHDFSSGGVNFYFKISSKRMKAKDVQVIPWMTSDTNWVRSPSQKLDPQKTVFVGALHGMLNALGLANVMNDLFDGVVYAGIDTDKFKYPIGSARVTFNNNRSYMKAVNARFIVLKTDKFVKKIQVDPYLEDSPCSLCAVQHGPYFCREISCFRYFCRSCWHWRHSLESSFASHTWLMRTSKSGSGMNSMTDVGMGVNMGLPFPVRGVRPSRLYNRLPADTLQ